MDKEQIEEIEEMIDNISRIIDVHISEWAIQKEVFDILNKIGGLLK